MRESYHLVLGLEGRATKKRTIPKLDKEILGVDKTANTICHFVYLMENK